MDVPIDKRALLALLHDRLNADLERSTGRAHDAAEAATHDENRPEGDKDMRSTEASYVARGQAARVREIGLAAAKLGAMPVHDFAPGESIRASALVELDQEGCRSWYLLVPSAGGERLRVGDVDVQTLATTSPLGAALIGLAEGDEVEVATPQGTRTYLVARVR